MLKNLTDIHFLERILEEGLFGRTVVAYAYRSLHQTHQSVKPLLCQGPTAEVQHFFIDQIQAPLQTKDQFAANEHEQYIHTTAPLGSPSNSLI
jgi:hypothetical protein